MAGYVRQDTLNNIADGNIINASDFDNEYDAIEAAFSAVSGHTHDGTAAEGAPITKVGPTQDVVVSISSVLPKTDNTIDLGSSLFEFKDLYIDGTANIDSLVADTADINAGTIDGVTIGGASPGAGTFTTVGATTGNITTVNATTVDTTNIEVTTLKAKDGTSAGSIANSTGVVTLASSVLTTTDINGGTIDGVTIGGAVRGSGSFTTLNSDGNTTLGDAVGDVVTVNGTTTFVNAAPTLTPLTASQAVFTNGSKTLVSNAITGTGNVVMSASPTLTGTVAGASMQLSSLTSGRVTYAGTSGLLQDSANFTFNGTDLTVSGLVNATTLDATNLEVTNLKAKDGTSAGSIANSTGVVTLASSVLTTADINGGTMDNVTIGGSTPAAGNFTTVDTTNLEVTNLKAKDGTVAATIANSTGIITVSTQLQVDNLNLSANTLSSTNSNGDILLTPNGTGRTTVTNLSATSPRFTTGINDSNGNELFLLTATASAVNEITVANAATGNAPKFTASGGDTNIDLVLAAKGTGQVKETWSSANWALASQYDIGTNANQIPLNQYLGSMAYQDASYVSVIEIDAGTVNATTILEQGEPVVTNADVGTLPNQIPLNQYLGAMAYQDSVSSGLEPGGGITLGSGTICQGTFSNMDGVKRATIILDLTGLNDGGTAGDIIGSTSTSIDSTKQPAYIAQLPVAFTVLGGRMTCLETPAGGGTDIDLYSATEGTGVQDSAVTALTETQIVNGGAQTAGTVTYFSADPAASSYLYMVSQGTGAAAYTAGRFLIEIFGV